MRVTFRRFPGHSSAYSVIERDDGVVYLDGAAPDRAPQSPLQGDLADLPPLLIVAGGDEA